MDFWWEGIVPTGRSRFITWESSWTQGIAKYAQLWKAHFLSHIMRRSCFNKITLTTTFLDYPRVIYMGLPLKTSNKLHAVQNMMIHLVDVCCHKHVTLVLFPMGLCMQVNVLILIYKPMEVFEWTCSQAKINKPLIYTSWDKLPVVSHIYKMKGAEFQRSCFSVLVLIIWNSLLPKVKLVFPHSYSSSKSHFIWIFVFEAHNRNTLEYLRALASTWARHS